MLTMYIDETIDKKSGICIVAGYLGKRKHWAALVDAWRVAISPHTSMHLNTMRLGSPSAPRRHGDLLKRLGAIPKECGLRPIVGSACEKDYRELVSGTVAEVILEGYVVAILAMLDKVKLHLPPDERVEIYFEQQQGFATQAERAMIHWNSIPHHRTSSDKPIVASWAFIEKSIRTEPSDYLCYALYQRDLDRTSQKAILTAPILNAQRYARNHVRREHVKKWLDEAWEKRKRPLLELTPHNRKLIRTMR
jgi:hypothetical protein